MRVKCFLVMICLAASSGGLAGADPVGSDEALAAARRFVEKSDRYLHHSHLRRGMKGYGLTVMAGAGLERFDVEIVSVMTKWGPHQDAVLARLSGLGLEKTGVIAGMSGSPVFVTDPADGKDKIIGAVAFGWTLQKEPVCGIQPITQMLAIQGILSDEEARTDTGPATSVRGRTGPFSTAPPREFLHAVLDPAKVDFASLARLRTGRAVEMQAGAGPDQPRLVPLSTPLMVTGLRVGSFGPLSEDLFALGMVPLQGGGIGPAEMENLEGVKLEPGGAIGIPLVAGDAEIAAIGTVTDVIGDRVLAFGHAFYGYGDLELPMGPAYVHTVVASIMRSFKIAAMVRRTGVLERDERVGVSGRVGSAATMVPMTIEIDWPGEQERQVFRYQLCRHHWFTPMVVSALVRDSASAWHDLPEYHTVRYSVDVDFGEFGKYHSENTSSGNDVARASSDAVRPLVALLNSPLGPPPEVRSISMEMSIEAVTTRCSIEELRLDGSIYAPGATVTGHATVRPFREWRRRIPIRFEIPEQLADGEYTLTACDAMAALSARQQEAPYRFVARTNDELLAAVQEVVEPEASRLYLRMPLKKGGVAIGPKPMPDLPESRARVLLEADPIDTKPFARTLERYVETEYVLQGSASASLTVQSQPSEMPVR